MKIWISARTKHSNHYALRVLGGIAVSVLLALALIGCSVYLGFYFESQKEVISVGGCILTSMLLIWTALWIGRKAGQDATIFVQDEKKRLFVIEAGNYVRSRSKIPGYIAMVTDTQKKIDDIKDYVNQKDDLSLFFPQIISVESIKENHTEYYFICRVQLPEGETVRRTCRLVKGYEEEEALLLALEQRRYREQAWEVRENRNPVCILVSGLLLAAAVIVCVLSHPAMGGLPRGIYFPCLGIAFVLFTVMLYFIIRQRRGE